jgi:hypothetical protein
MSFEAHSICLLKFYKIATELNKSIPAKVILTDGIVRNLKLAVQ